MLSTFGQPLIDRNAICGSLTDESTAADQSEATSSQFIIECSEPLMGRYLSIQLMQYGSLQLDEVKVLPEPGNLECFHFMCVYNFITRCSFRKVRVTYPFTLQHFFLTYNMKVMCVLFCCLALSSQHPKILKIREDNNYSNCLRAKVLLPPLAF